MRHDPLQFLAEELAALRAQDALGVIRVLDGPQLPKASIDGRDVPLAASGEVKYTLRTRPTPYKVALRRPGYEKVERRVTDMVARRFERSGHRVETESELLGRASQCRLRILIEVPSQVHQREYGVTQLLLHGRG